MEQPTRREFYVYPAAAVFTALSVLGGLFTWAAFARDEALSAESAARLHGSELVKRMPGWGFMVAAFIVAAILLGVAFEASFWAHKRRVVGIGTDEARRALGAAWGPLSDLGWRVEYALTDVGDGLEHWMGHEILPEHNMAYRKATAETVNAHASVVLPAFDEARRAIDREAHAIPAEVGPLRSYLATLDRVYREVHMFQVLSVKRYRERLQELRAARAALEARWHQRDFPSARPAPER